jgi:hypothetical protein
MNRWEVSLDPFARLASVMAYLRSGFASGNRSPEKTVLILLNGTVD